MSFPYLLAHSLVVYKLQVSHAGDCATSPFPLVQNLSPTLSTLSFESHFHVPIPNDQSSFSYPVYLHSHSRGPFLSGPHAAGGPNGLTLDIYTLGNCKIHRMRLSVDWFASLGRLGPRYWTALCVWGLGIVGLLIGEGIMKWRASGEMMTTAQSLRHMTLVRLPWIAGVIFVLSCIPFPPPLLLGLSGEPVFVWVPMICFIVATGLVWITIGLLEVLVAIIRLIATMLRLDRNRPENSSVLTWQRVLSMSVLLVFVSTVIPYQVAFAVLWLLHIWTCSTSAKFSAVDRAFQGHLLLLQTWVLPLVLPVLAIWVKTILNAGIFAPFDGDHNILQIIFIMIAVESLSIGVDAWPQKDKELVGAVAQTAGNSLAGYAVLLGARYSFGIYSIVNGGLACIVVASLWPRVLLVWTGSKVLN